MREQTYVPAEDMQRRTLLRYSGISTSTLAAQIDKEMKCEDAHS